MSARNRGLAISALVLTAAVARDARGWEAFCRDPVALGKQAVGGISDPKGHYRNRLVVDSICADPSVPECSDGMGAARGWFTGEHRYITETALRMLGLGLSDDATNAGVFGRPDADGSYLFDYYVDNQPVDFAGTGSTQKRLTPAGPAGMHASAEYPDGTLPTTLARDPWIAELSELPDGSYSLADYILGNETCLAPNALLRYQGPPSAGVTGFLPVPASFSAREQIDACHSFKSHMGSVNSTHFGSQAAAMWFVHHQIALSIARRCSAMWSAAKSTQGTAAYEDFRTRLGPACEREAFAFDAVAAHYMEDAWSEGHMWERWGSPSFSGTIEGQMEQAITGAVSGLEHGWRYVAQRFTQGLHWYDSGTWWLLTATRGEAAQHDQMCLPGPPRTTFFTHPLASWSGDDLTVKYTYAGSTAAPLAGGGDLYLLPCNAIQKNDTTWAVAGSSDVVPVVGDAGVGDDFPIVTPSNLVDQYKRMLTCVSFSFSEVYKAGPGPDKTYRPNQPKEVGPFDQKLVGVRSGGFPTSFPASTITPDGSLFQQCFGQRATNHSMVLGSGVTDWGGFDSIGLRSMLTVANLPNLTTEKANLDTWVGKPTPGKRFAVSDRNFQTLQISFARSISIFSIIMAENDRDNPDGIQNAQIAMPSPYDTILEQKPNQQGVPPILQGQLGYMENPDVTKWTSAPPANQPDDCTTHDDTYCPGLYPGTFCDRTHAYATTPKWTGTYGAVPATRGTCVPLETAVLRAFHGAELPYWCANDTLDDLEASRATCQAAAKVASPSGVNSAVPECDACVQMLLPHMRASPNSTAYANASDFMRRRSTCDVLEAGGVGALSNVALDATSVYVPFDPVSQNEAAAAARYVCSISTKIPSDPSPPMPTPSASRPSFLRASGVSACFAACDGTTTCIQPDSGGQFPYGGMSGALEVHQVDPYTAYGDHYPAFDKGLLFGAESRVVDIALGLGGACVARSDGTVWCAGENSHGQLGIGDPSTAASVVPRQVPMLAGIQHVYTLDGLTMCASDAGGNAWCWGYDGSGQVGDVGSTDRFSPVPLAVSGVAEIGMMGTRPCARTTGGAIWCWGVNGPPKAIPGVSGATQLAGGGVYLAGGTVMTWLWDQGDPFPGCDNAVPIDIGGFGPVEEIGFDGTNQWCVRDKPGNVSCFSGWTGTTGMTTCLAQSGPNPPFSAMLTAAPIKADALSVNTINLGGFGPVLFARQGRSLYALGAVTAGPPSVPIDIPVLSASEAPETCQ